MAEIKLLDSSTIDKIAAGEVVERPSSVVKELVENAMDAGAKAVTVEIRDGGCSFIRVTDNGGGIEKEQVRKAFFRHATSKIRSVEDLYRVRNLGFRGEALSSIAAVSMVELITKTKEELTGVHYRLEGEKERDFSEVGAPEGTTIIVRELFFNTPVRKKFLKSPATEGSYISDLMEHMALSRPDVAFQFMMNGQVRFHTSGNGDLKEIVYRIYGREIVKELIPFSVKEEGIEVEGFLGSPSVVRSNRNFEFFFVNGRYIKSPLLSKGLEAGYKAYLMQHKFPFALLHINMDTERIDVNVHPSKMEIRFHDQPGLYAFLEEQVRTALRRREMIPDVTFADTKEKKRADEKKADEKKESPKVQTAQSQQAAQPAPAAETVQAQVVKKAASVRQQAPDAGLNISTETVAAAAPVEAAAERAAVSPPSRPKPEAPQPFETQRLGRMLQEEEGQYTVKDVRQMELFEEKLLTKEAVQSYRILGQVFDTYWIAEYEEKLLFIDQHAAHEKVKYEALINKLENGSVDSQMLTPPIVLNLSAREAHLLEEYSSYFAQLGFEIEEFGGNAYAVRSVPCDLYGHCEKEFLEAILDELEEEPPHGAPKAIAEKLASMACKSAVKGNHSMSREEMASLLEQLLQLENPYHCPHGRPTIITMSKYELERKFKRII
ncbi:MULTISPECIES: DNA mismatch repair endonuclease MutL [Eisenbergiella]|uniref:DNA mismatch repair protein MutL n=1 Tax=Eisenbergiella porci TaxID=2652274 RepID=A0A6N7W0X9_9FIRM|nr:MULTISPECIES: DNA mismatch repair endonuclease MutL [Eisenbergiella]MDY2652145.1 DNA mismatch repair endonuclease MutL [Eisenbergiella porci]MSS88909.1 DNA mismatch repair endonuclease MutL [Eisenbergiella porci]